MKPKRQSTVGISLAHSTASLLTFPYVPIHRSAFIILLRPRFFALHSPRRLAKSLDWRRRVAP